MSTVRLILSLILFGLIFGSPFAYSTYRQKQYRNFRIVQEGVLYRSGQMTHSAMKRTLDEYRIKTVISFRSADDPAQEPPDFQEEKYCRDLGLNYHRIRTHQWNSVDDSPAPAWKNVNQFLKVMDENSNYPVLVHCFAGMHRTGPHCAIYRMEYQGWTNRDAIEEMRRLGYKNIDTETDVRGFLEAYRKR